MMGMEKMLAGMLGITPEQMQENVSGLMNAATNSVAALETITAQNALILERLDSLQERLDNGD